MQSSKTEGRSSYQGRDEGMWSGAEGKSGTSRSVMNRVLKGSTNAMTIWQRVNVEEIVKRWLGTTGESDDLNADR